MKKFISRLYNRYKAIPAPMSSNLRILFILKERYAYGSYSMNYSSGLYNSAKFCSDMLAAAGYTTKLVEVLDNNSIDHEVTIFQPDIVIIEALWVVPEKFDILQMLHPTVNWIVRIHSEAPFLAQEGIGIDWLSHYPLNYSNVFVAVNSKEAEIELLSFYPEKGINPDKLLYLPTYYPAPDDTLYFKSFSGGVLNVACMGAIRQLKNVLIQAMAAMRFAEETGWHLRFHINGDIFDAEGRPTNKSLTALFEDTDYELIRHKWMEHDEFIAFLAGIDVGMQVSFSETFCIVAADYVASGIPVVGSPAIKWLDKRSQTDTIKVQSIADHIGTALRNRGMIDANLEHLQEYSRNAKKAWLEVLRNF